MYSAWLGRVWVGKDKRWEGDFPPHRWDQHMNPEIRCKDSAWGELTQVSAVGSIFLVFRLWSADLRFTSCFISCTDVCCSCCLYTGWCQVGVNPVSGSQHHELNSDRDHQSHTVLYFKSSQQTNLFILLWTAPSFMQYHSQPTLPWTWMNLLSRVQNDVWLTTRGVSWLCSWSGRQCKLPL